MNVHEKSRRADMARQILDNELFAETFDALRESLRKQRMAVKADDSAGQTNLILTEQVLNSFEHYLKRVIADEAVAKANAYQEQPQPVFQR